MRKQVLQIANDKIYYKNDCYDFYGDYIKTMRNIGVIILNEDLYSKVLPISKKKKVDNGEISKVIHESFGEDEDYLFHYFLNKKKLELRIYAIKGGVRVGKVSEESSKLKVIPFQLIVSKKISRLLSLKSWKSIFKYKDCYYYILFKDGFIHKSFAEEVVERFSDRLQEEDENNIYYVDESIVDIISAKLKEFKVINLGGVLNERGICKQRFFTY